MMTMTNNEYLFSIINGFVQISHKYIHYFIKIYLRELSHLASITKFYSINYLYVY